MPTEPQSLPVYPPCPKCGSTTACPCPAFGPDTLIDQLSNSFRPDTVNIATVFPGARKSDWERSVAIWRQQAADLEDERRRLIAKLEYEERKNRF